MRRCSIFAGHCRGISLRYSLIFRVAMATFVCDLLKYSCTSTVNYHDVLPCMGNIWQGKILANRTSIGEEKFGKYSLYAKYIFSEYW